jgi:hypothetical protein
MNRDETLNITSKPVAEEANPEQEDNPNVRNDLPKGVDKPDGELPSLNADLKRVEKRTTM